MLLNASMVASFCLGSGPPSPGGEAAEGGDRGLPWGAGCLRNGRCCGRSPLCSSGHVLSPYIFFFEFFLDFVSCSFFAFCRTSTSEVRRANFLAPSCGPPCSTEPCPSVRVPCTPALTAGVWAVPGSSFPRERGCSRLTACPSPCPSPDGTPGPNLAAPVPGWGPPAAPAAPAPPFWRGAGRFPLEVPTEGPLTLLAASQRWAWVSIKVSPCRSIFDWVAWTVRVTSETLIFLSVAMAGGLLGGSCVSVGVCAFSPTCRGTHSGLVCADISWCVLAKDRPRPLPIGRRGRGGVGVSEAQKMQHGP